MSEKEFERYLKLLGNLLGITRQQRDAIATELRDHFDTRLDDLLAQGIPREDAIHQALEEFGDVAGLAHQFLDLARSRKRKQFIRATTFSMGGMAIAILLLFAMWPQNARVPMTSTTVAQSETSKPAANAADDDSEDSEADRTLWKTLAEKTEIEFADTPLKEVIDFLVTKHNIEMVLDKSSLETAGVGDDSPITLRFKKGRLQSALNLILQRLELDWYVDEGAIIIASASDVQNTLRTRVYNVSDLLRIGSDRSSTEESHLLHLLQRHTGGRMEGWSEVGGIGNVLTSVDGVVVVSHTPKSHAEIQGFLSALRKMRDSLEKGGSDSLRSINAQPESDAEKAITKALAAKCPPLEFADTPLNEVIPFLAERQGIEIQMDLRAFEAAGIGTDSPVNFKLRSETTLRTALGRLLRQLSLTTIIRNDALVVTTLDAADAALATRIYPLFDLLSTDRDQAQDEMSNFVRVITTTTGNPRVSWTEAGGAGVVDEIAGLRALAVTTTQETHDQIDKLLDGIRRSRRSVAKNQKQKLGSDSAAVNIQTVKVWFITPHEKGAVEPVSAERLKATIVELLGISVDPATITFMTSLNDRLVIRATPALHRRIEKLAVNELSGLMAMRSPNGMGGAVMAGGIGNVESAMGGVLPPAVPANPNTPPVLPPPSND